VPIALAAEARTESAHVLNVILADTMILHALYKKHHWLVAGPTFYQLHLLFDKHADEQLELVDLLAERVQSLGGIAVGDLRHASELNDNKDWGSNDLLMGDVLRRNELQAWFLSAHTVDEPLIAEPLAGRRRR
jgi:starvation-inducible DNA-binding protein